MGGCWNDDDRKFASDLTLVLGTKSFESRRSSSGVTATSELKTTRLNDGCTLNVIDTPGMVDLSADPESIQKEIVRCIHMARDGTHAVLVVFSVSRRFSEEEQAVVYSLVELFGSKIYDYMIVVFTCGDELEVEGKSLQDFLSGCSDTLKDILCLCGNRCVLFDNRTKDETEKSCQVQQLLSCVNLVLEKNDGVPYTSEIFALFKKEFTEKGSLLLTDRQSKLIIELLESKFIEIELKLQKLLEEERAARVKAELKASEVQNKYEKDVKELKDKLGEERKKNKEKEKEKKDEHELKLYLVVAF